MVVNVPNVPGVPSVVFANPVGQVVRALVRDAVNLVFGVTYAPYGIFQGGGSIIAADTALSFDYKQQWSISDFPVERGGFESYNKVATPFEAGFQFTCGGSDARRSAFLSSIAAIAGNTQLYNVVTPQAVYINVNIARYDYKQTATDGVGLLTVSVFTTEIRQAAGGILSATKSPVSAAQVNNGPVQAAPATTSQASSFTIPFAGPQ